MLFFFSSRRRHTRYWRDWSSDVCSSDLGGLHHAVVATSSWPRLADSSRWASTCASSRRALSSIRPTASSPATQRSGGSPLADRERGVLGKRGDLGGGRII